jgi:hypothetical protein
MTRYNRIKNLHIGLLGTISSSVLIGLSGIPVVAQTVPYGSLNPCASIYYEEPYRDRVILPPQCSPNVITQKLIERGLVSSVPDNTSPIYISQATPAQPPLTENQQNAIAIVQPRAGRVQVKLRNDTNTKISYQAIGHTDLRTLAGGEEIVLRDLPTPVTITMVREDGGLLNISPTSASDSDREILTLSLDETNNFGNNQGAVRIQSNGVVYLN